MHSSTCLWPFARSLTRSRRYFFFFSIHSPLTCFRQCFGSLWLNCGDPTAFQIASFIFEPILTIPSSWKHSFAKWVPQIMECSLGSKKSARLTWTKLIHWRRILSSYFTHHFSIVKTKKYSCRKLENTRACKGPKDLFDFWWADIPFVMSQQRGQNQNGGRSELSEVISRVKMRLYRKKP